MAPEFVRPRIEQSMAKTYDKIKKSIKDISQNIDPNEPTTSLLHEY